MIRVHVTASAPIEPALAAGGPAAARRAAEALEGVLTVEVDGVDLTGGRAEGPLLPALEGLLGALARVQAGAAAAAAELRHGELLLLLRRRRGEVGLTLIELGPPSRLPACDVAVDLGLLTAAALDAAAALCRALAGAPPAEALAARRLRGAARRPRPGPAAAGAAPGQPGAPAPRAGAVRCEVALDDEALEAAASAAIGGPAPAGLAALLLPGEVRLVLSGRALAVPGLPFLTLRDLVAGLAEAALAEQRGDRATAITLGRAGRRGDATLRLDLAAGTLAWDGAPPMPAGPLEVARGVREGAQALADRLAGALPAGGLAPLAELLAAAGAAEALLAERALGDLPAADGAPAPRLPAPRAAASQAPLGPGELRRVALRVAWQDHVGAPVGPGLLAAGPVLLAVGEEAVCGRSGPRRWRAPGADWAALAAGLLLLRRGDQLLALEPGSGRERWRRALTDAHPTGAAGRRGGPLLLGESGALAAHDPRTGEVRWRLELPGGHGLALAALGPLLAAGTGSGLLYGLDLEGRVAWRVRAPGPALAPPLLLGRALASLHAAGPGAALLLVDPATGGRLAEVPLDVTPAGEPIRAAGGLAVAGRSGGAAAVTLVRPRGGRAWTVEAPLEGTPRLRPTGRGLLVAGAGGALVRLEPDGRLAWSLPAAAGAEAGSSVAPAAFRGVVAAAREGVAVVDLATGRVLGAAAGLHPARLAATGAGAVTALEADGTVTGLVPAGHLSLLRGARQG